jgi:hypothetical protein
VTVVGRPPVLGSGHQIKDVFLYGIQIEALERLRVVERFAHRIGQGRVLAQDVQFQLIGPPVAVSRATPGALLERSTMKRALAFAVDVVA